MSAALSPAPPIAVWAVLNRPKARHAVPGRDRRHAAGSPDPPAAARACSRANTPRSAAAPPIRTDVRILAATNRDLRQLISQGMFREDLYYRLNVVPLRLPPLRERVEDIPDLVRHFLRKAEDEGLPHKTLDNESLDLLRRHRWPGTVRELENLIRRLAVLQPGDSITASAVSAELKEPAKTFTADSGEGPQSLGASVEQYLTQYFLSQGDRLPPPGVYDRIVQEVELPVDLHLPGSNTRQPDPRRPTLGSQPQYPAQEDQGSRVGSHPRASNRIGLRTKVIPQRRRAPRVSDLRGPSQGLPEAATSAPPARLSLNTNHRQRIAIRRDFRAINHRFARFPRFGAVMFMCLFCDAAFLQQSVPWIHCARTTGMGWGRS